MSLCTTSQRFNTARRIHISTTIRSQNTSVTSISATKNHRLCCWPHTTTCRRHFAPVANSLNASPTQIIDHPEQYNWPQFYNNRARLHNLKEYSHVLVPSYVTAMTYTMTRSVRQATAHCKKANDNAHYMIILEVQTSIVSSTAPKVPNPLFLHRHSPDDVPTSAEATSDAVEFDVIYPPQIAA